MCCCTIHSSFLAHFAKERKEENEYQIDSFALLPIYLKWKTWVLSGTDGFGVKKFRVPLLKAQSLHFGEIGFHPRSEIYLKNQLNNIDFCWKR